MNRADILSHFAGAAGYGKQFWGVGVADAVQVDAALRAGASWVLVNHAGGLDPAVPASAIGLLPYADANSEVLAMGNLAVGVKIPAFAGVFASDQFRIMRQLLKDIKSAGFDAVQNFPSVGLAEGRLNAFLTDAAMGYQLEVELVRQAREQGFFASAVVFNAEQALAMVKAGADMLVFHPGLNADGEYREWNASARQRYAEVAAAVPLERADIVMARMAFEFEDGAAADADGGLGVQYDRNMVEAKI